MQRRTFVRSVVAGALALTMSAAAGCSDDSGDDGGSGKGGSLEKITYLTSFGTFGRDSYAYVALDKGYFKDAGFDVEVKPGSGTGENIKTIVAGKAQFTPVDLTGALLNAGGKDKVTGFTAVAAVQQRTMAAIISLEGNGINSPKDLEGKTLADQPGSVVQGLFPTYAKLANIDDKKVTWQPTAATALMGTLASGKVKGIGQFVVGKPTVEGIAKKPAVVLPYSDYLQDLYGNVIITSSDYAKNNPDKVKKFNEALLKGLQDSIDNPADAGKIMTKYVQTAKAEAVAAELTLMAPYVRSAAAGIPVGALDAERVARSIAILQGSGQIDPGLKPEAVINFDLTPKA
ncbi:ABC transporter substrate-binding protein [Actinoplanes sp. NPDC049596]|uniref:ABC transporter substrate-binding protein n=1 Tax=unclassified Actinoplanes TaxID=2626549 RepID=UPI00341C32EE